MNTVNTLLILGCGYVGSKLAAACVAQGIKVKATVRNQEAADKLMRQGFDVAINENPALLDTEWLADCDAVLDSIPLSYDEKRQPFETQSSWVNALVKKLPNLKWVGYYRQPACMLIAAAIGLMRLQNIFLQARVVCCA